MTTPVLETSDGRTPEEWIAELRSMDGTGGYEDPALLRELYWERGLGTPEIGRMFGVSPAAISNAMRMYNIPLRPRTTPKKAISTDRMIRLYREGWSFTVIGRSAGVSASYARKLLIREGVHAPDPSRRGRPR